MKKKTNVALTLNFERKLLLISVLGVVKSLLAPLRFEQSRLEETKQVSILRKNRQTYRQHRQTYGIDQIHTRDF